MSYILLIPLSKLQTFGYEIAAHLDVFVEPKCLQMDYHVVMTDIAHT